VVPQGGNTGLVGGSVPTGARRELLLSLGRMNRIRSLDLLNDTATVEAGCILAAIQSAAADAGGCSRSRSPPRAAARSAATSPPTPAA
jgi:FAD/FMN-containing dehydrogenase